MRLTLDYGRSGLELQLDDDLKVSLVEPGKGVPLAEPRSAVAAALQNPIGTPPLADMARGKRNAAVVISDKTRPIPYGVVLPPLLACLEAAGINRERIEIIVATGLHRPNSDSELAEMASPELVSAYRFRNHAARDMAAHLLVGTTQRGTAAWIDRGFMQADLKVVTGLIEPHLMAGYSGGRKAVCPGLAGVETMRTAHGPRMLEDRVGPGIVDDNPFHADLMEIAALAGVDFMCDVSIDRARRLTGVFAGDIAAAHRAGIAAVERHVRVDLDEAADIVITSAGGYPLDQTLYQSIKGLTGALNLVRRGGTIILAAELAEGIGSVDFQELLRDVRSGDEYMQRISSGGFFRVDQWMVQHLCQVTRKANVVIANPRFSPQSIGNLPVHGAPSVQAAVEMQLRHFGRQAHIAVVPQGPYVLGTVRGRMLPLGTAWIEAA